ncbi:MAG: hypothetical protein V1753_05475 [Pseudomonadota bacterium]
MSSNPGNIIESLSKELAANIKTMSKAKTIEEKIQYSQIINNLSKPLEIFINLASEMMDADFDE